MGAVYPGERNPNWRGGRSVASNGYVLLRRPGHPLADVRGYVYEHRLVASEQLGRPLRRGEIVHHLNGNKTDNRPENLEVCGSLRDHQARHRPENPDLRKQGQPNPSVVCSCGCGSRFRRYDAYGRPRRFVQGHNLRPGARS